MMMEMVCSDYSYVLLGSLILSDPVAEANDDAQVEKKAPKPDLEIPLQPVRMLCLPSEVYADLVLG